MLKTFGQLFDESVAIDVGRRWSRLNEEACSSVMRPSTARSRNLETGKEGLLEDASARLRAPIKYEGWCQMMVPETVGCGASCAEGNGEGSR